MSTTLRRLVIVACFLCALCTVVMACTSEAPEPPLDVSSDADGDSSGEDSSSDGDAETEAAWTCGSDAQWRHQPAFDTDCADNVGCNRVFIDRPCESACSRCDNERCVESVADDTCWLDQDTMP